MIYRFFTSVSAPCCKRRYGRAALVLNVDRHPIEDVGTEQCLRANSATSRQSLGQRGGGGSSARRRCPANLASHSACQARPHDAEAVADAASGRDGVKPEARGRPMGYAWGGTGEGLEGWPCGEQGVARYMAGVSDALRCSEMLRDDSTATAGLLF